MCLIGLQWQSHGHRLRIAANRDEFHARQTAAADWWPSSSAGNRRIFGGRDLQAGGGWLACTPDGRVAAVTNVRGAATPPQLRSRGGLVADFLTSDLAPAAFLGGLAPHADAYAGFNLIVSDGSTCCYASNTPDWHSRALEAGIHVVSNADLDTPWPKTERLRTVLEADADEESLFQALADDQPAHDDELPDTGVGPEMERFLSPPFIRGQTYGTRASTVLSVQADGAILFEERCFAADGVPAGHTRTVIRS